MTFSDGQVFNETIQISDSSNERKAMRATNSLLKLNHY